MGIFPHSTYKQVLQIQTFFRESRRMTRPSPKFNRWMGPHFCHGHKGPATPGGSWKFGDLLGLGVKQIIYLLQTTIFERLFQLDDSKSLHGKLLFNQTSIKNWLFRVPGIYGWVLQFLIKNTFHGESGWATWAHTHILPVVPHEAVAEVSRRGKL